MMNFLTKDYKNKAANRGELLLFVLLNFKINRAKSQHI